MQKEKITIEVPAKTAEAYRSASPEQREKAEKALAFALLPREETVQAFRELTERTSNYAAQQGLTPEKLDELLSDEDA